MKFQLALVLVALVVVTSAGRKHIDDAGCKFVKGEWSECDSSNQMKRTLTLREQNDGCPATKEQTRPCKDKKSKGCKYRADGDWSECDTALNIRTRKVVLHKGDSHCALEKTNEISCDKYQEIVRRDEERKKARERATAMKAEKKVLKHMQKKLKQLKKIGCQYVEEKSQCNNETQKVTLTFTFESGSDPSCVMEPVEVSCELHEKYEKIKQAKMEKKERKKKEKMERKKNKKLKDKKNKKERRKQRKSEGKCKYQRGPWSDCDITTDTMKMTMTLKKGDATKCAASKTLSKKCKKPCKYTTGKWGPCVHGITERVDRLKKNSQDICESLRKLTKKCKGKKKIKKRKGGCIYGQGEWGECDPQTNKRAKTKLLTSGSLLHCKSQKVVYRSCLRNDGKDRCFFGKWGNWSSCQNGVQKKQREVVQGGVDCQKRAVRTKPCS